MGKKRGVSQNNYDLAILRHSLFNIPENYLSNNFESSLLLDIKKQMQIQLK